MLVSRILRDESVFPASSGQVVFELPKTGALSGLLLSFKLVNDSTSGVSAVVPVCFPRIEVIVNGSIPVYSVTPYISDKLSCLYLKNKNCWVRSHWPGDTQYFDVLIPFGRYLGDSEFYLKLDNLMSAELRITYSIYAAAGFFATTGHTYKITGYFIEPAPTTYLGCSKHVLLYQTSSSAVEERVLRMPQPSRLRGIFVYARKQDKTCNSIIPDITLDVNDKSKILIAQSWNDIERQNLHEFGINEPRYVKTFLKDNDGLIIFESIPPIVTYTLYKDYAAGEDFTYNTIANINPGIIIVSHILVEGSATWAATTLDTTPRTGFMQISGPFVGDMIFVKTYEKDEFENYLNTAEFANVNLRLVIAESGAAIQVVPNEIIVL